MINIEKLSTSSFEKTIDFLKTVPSIESIDEKILNNACIASEDDRIVGCISYEEYGMKGLIRYFVFKKALDMSYLDSLLDELKKNALKNEIKEFVCLAESDQIKDLFKGLDFNEVNVDNIFIDEENIDDTSFKTSCFLNMHLI